MNIYYQRRNSLGHTKQCPRLQNVIKAMRGANIENFKRNSTGNASWRGLNIEKLNLQFLQTMQVGGAPT
ncbi:TPA: hypothetical protein I2T90_07415 [Staphylococcus aureus]|nr:hypothetical protein CU118_07640 [Staphylococcus aureus]MSN57262.1 hypothetical protein [Staphylococcus aureus]MSN63006.1 hypothetical protein [Staphylococcus aureus]MSN65658.1 hypothetical protein [Staphylococcus aureus]MSN71012.1 hypothetical protein [Staphylococcus aureus]